MTAPLPRIPHPTAPGSTAPADRGPADRGPADRGPADRGPADGLPAGTTSPLPASPLGLRRAPGTIMVTGVGGPAGRSLVAQLRRRREEAGLAVRVVAVDMTPPADACHDPAVDVADVVRGAADADYAASMRDALARHRPDLVVPTVSDELPQIAVLAEALGLGHPAPGGDGRVVIPGAGPTAVAADKLLTMWRLERAGVAVPRFAPAASVADTGAALAAWGGPVVVKPRVSRGGRGVVLLERDDQPWPLPTDGLIVQGFAAGTEYSPQLYRSPLTGATTVVVLEKTELKQGRVGNASRVQRLPEGAAADVADVAARTATALDLTGPLDMDVRRDSEGRPLVLEVNSRFGAHSAHAPELLDALLADWWSSAG